MKKFKHVFTFLKIVSFLRDRSRLLALQIIEMNQKDKITVVLVHVCKVATRTLPAACMHV